MLFPNADDRLLREAFAAFDRAFDQYPFDFHVAYFAPMHMGPSLPLWLESTGWKACMVGPVYDDLKKWRYIFPEELFREQFKKLSEIWREGLDLLQRAYEGREMSDDDRLLLDCARGSYYHFRSTYNHIDFVMERGNSERMLGIIDEERELAILDARLVNKNPTIGYESSNHYFFTRSDLVEKVLICDFLKSKIERR
jgi:hypothetical protein